MTNQEAAEFARLKKIANDHDFAKKAGTVKGFFDMYFLEVKNFTTKIDCFNFLNEKYEKIYGELRYSDWASFAKMKNYYLKKQTKK